MTIPRTPVSALLVGALALVLAACSAAPAGGEIGVSDARVPVPVSANGAAYLTLTNNTGGNDRLVAVSTDIAEAAELHQTTTEDGSMAMQQVEGIEIPADGRVVLEPGSYHVMLIGVTEGLAVGDSVDLTLTFENAPEQTVTADVVPAGDVSGMTMSEPGDTAS